MKKNFSLITFILFYFLVNPLANDVYSQNLSNFNTYTPVSSLSLSLGDLSNISNSTDMFTGRLNYGINLTTVPMAGINIPIGINYSTTGFKVQEVSGVLGLGWTSNFTGVITRAVRDLPDESYYGFCGPSRTGGINSNVYTNDLFNKINSIDWDSEPDQYYFSFLGISGSFVLDPDGKPVLQSSASGIQIIESAFVRGKPQLDNKWVLRDQLGNQYIFGEEATETAQNYHHGETNNTYQTYPSSWYIKKIITFNKKEINFIYESNMSVSYTNYVNMKRIVQPNNCSNLSNASWNENIDLTTLAPLYLNKIEYNNQRIQFDYDHTRLDLPYYNKALSSIRVFYGNKEENNYSFNYGYFNSDDGTNTKRLKLQSISENHLGSLSKVMQSFFYNEQTNLPARNSLKTDTWGYYNANTANNNLIGESDKTSNYNNTKANVLEKVTNAMGASTYFEYQLNNYFENSQNKDVGGLRISKIYEKAKDTDTKINNQIQYDYNLVSSNQSSGQVFNNNPNANFYINYSCTRYSNDADLYESSEPINSLYDTNGSPVGYSYVTIKKSDGSVERYKYTNYSDYPDEYEQGLYDYTSSHATLYTRSPNPMYGITSMSFARGKMLMMESLNSNGEIVKKSDFSYEETAKSEPVIGFISLITRASASQLRYSFGKYKFFTQDLILKTKSETYYKSNIAKQQISQIYSYTDYAKNLVRSINETNAGKTDKYTFRYPFDVIPSIPTAQPGTDLSLSYMVYNNVIANPVEAVHSVIKNGVSKIVSVNTTQYSSFNNGNLVLPYTEFSFESKYPLSENEYVPYKVTYNNGHEDQNRDLRLKPYKIYNKYDENSNLLEVQSTTGQHSSNLFGYDGLYKIAEVGNSDYANVAYTSFESSEKGNWNYNGYSTIGPNAVTGNKMYNLALGPINKTNLLANKNYILTYWTKNTSAYIIAGTQGVPVQIADRNGWHYFQHKISGVTEISISGNNFIDEVRLYPSGASMVTYTYNPFIGITSKADQNDKIVYSEYDEYHRLQFTKDDNKNILRAFSYNNQGDSVNYFNSFSNSKKHFFFMKNDCGPEYSSSSSSDYTVEAGTYTASSQVAADSMAYDEIIHNGQAYANANGTCSKRSIYVRVELSNYYSDLDNHGIQTSADANLKSYLDSGCTIPYALPHPITVVVAEGYENYIADVYSDAGSNNVSFAMPMGISSFYMGKIILDDSQTYTDPFGHFVTDYSYYYFDVIDNDNTYVPKETQYQ